MQETRGYDSNAGITFSMREKESAHDYRYFPEPDIPPFYITREYIYDVKQQMPVLHEQLIELFINEHGLSLQDAVTLTEDKDTASFYLSASGSYSSYNTLC